MFALYINDNNGNNNTLIGMHDVYSSIVGLFTFSRGVRYTCDGYRQPVIIFDLRIIRGFNIPDPPVRKLYSIYIYIYIHSSSKLIAGFCFRNPTCCRTTESYSTMGISSGCQREENHSVSRRHSFILTRLSITHVRSDAATAKIVHLHKHRLWRHQEILRLIIAILDYCNDVAIVLA